MWKGRDQLLAKEKVSSVRWNLKEVGYSTLSESMITNRSNPEVK